MYIIYVARIAQVFRKTGYYLRSLLFLYIDSQEKDCQVTFLIGLGSRHTLSGTFCQQMAAVSIRRSGRTYEQASELLTSCSV